MCMRTGLGMRPGSRWRRWAGAFLLLAVLVVLWTVVAHHEAGDGPDGSWWLVVQQARGDWFPARGVWVGFGVLVVAWCVVVLALGVRARRRPRCAQVVFLVVAGVLLALLVHPAAYALWLLPLAVVARPRWRDLVMWRSSVGEVVGGLREGAVPCSRKGTDMTDRTYSRTAPADLDLPTWLVDRARHLERFLPVLDHGFTRSELGPGWWEARGITLDFPSTGPTGEPTLARGDLLRLGGDVGDDESLLRFCWHVVAWTSRGSRRNNARRIESVGQHVDVLREAHERAREGDVEGAYASLVLPGRARIPHFGPAFSTRFLRFAGGTARPGCLALDARVSQSLSQVGWEMSAGVAHGTFSHTWPVDTYVSYCDLLDSWSEQTGREVSADMLERALWLAAEFPDQTMTTRSKVVAV